MYGAHDEQNRELEGRGPIHCFGSQSYTVRYWAQSGTLIGSEAGKETGKYGSRSICEVTGRLPAGRADKKAHHNYRLCSTEVEEQVTAVTSALLRAYKASCPETVVDEHDITPWWNDELEALKKSARRAFNRYMRKKDSKSWEAYKASKRELKKALRHC